MESVKYKIELIELVKNVIDNFNDIIYDERSRTNGDEQPDSASIDGWVSDAGDVIKSLLGRDKPAIRDWFADCLIGPQLLPLVGDLPDIEELYIYDNGKLFMVLTEDELNF